MNAGDPRPRVVMVDGVPMSALVATAPDPRAVLVAIHGGATSSAYFDCPGNPRLSLLRNAVAHGFTTIAIDRPGYGASALYQDEMTSAERRVALTLGAVDRILGETTRGAGLFVMAHSAGCELGLRLAAEGSVGVIGVELAGTGLRYRAEAMALIKRASTTTRPVGLRDLLWQPTALYPPEVLTGALSAGGSAYEAEMTANWPRRDFADVAARVRVPVQYTVADHEAVWESTSRSLTDVVALFTAAPSVKLNEMSSSGHNLSVGLTAETYHQRVLSFVDECVASASAKRRAT